MKFCRLFVDGKPAFARVEGGDAVLLDGAPWAGGREAGRTVPLASARLMCPSDPSKIVGVGLNYKKHAEEMGKPLPERPLIFLKPPTASLWPGETILLPAESGEVHFEAELAVVFGRPIRRATAAEARAAVFGFTCFNDVTARDIQRAELQYTRCKGFDTFAPFGPLLETDVDPSHLAVESRVNGKARQKGDTSDMVFDVFALASFVSWTMTLLPGDVLTTGTPPGVGPLAPGDVVEVEVAGVGCLKNPVARDEG